MFEIQTQATPYRAPVSPQNPAERVSGSPMAAPPGANPPVTAPPDTTELAPQEQNQVQNRPGAAHAPANLTFPDKPVNPGAILGKAHADPPAAHLPDQHPVGALNTREERLQVLENLTQFDGLRSTRSDPARCGAAALTAAALLDGGREGLGQLIDGLRAQNQNLPANRRLNLGELESVSRRLNGGQDLRYQDLSQIQDTAYRILNREQEVFYSTPTERHPQGRPNPTGLTNGTLQRFLSSQPQLQTQFQRQGSSLRQVDIDGSNPERGGHFVLSFPHNGGSAIYDPYPRRDARQVVTDPAQVDLYRRAQATIGGVVFPPAP